MIINSNSLTFIDTTDTKKIDVHITSNHPTVQIFDSNRGTYTPNWNPNEVVDNVAGTSLVLSATVYADSINVTDLTETTYQWFKDNDFERPLTDSKGVPITTKELTISTNMLESIVEYTCKATYNSKTYDNKIVLTLVTTGKNGVDGQPGKDGIDGKDGKSVGIKGVAYTNEVFVAGKKVILYSDSEYKNPITIGGDADTVDGYLVDGYLCVYTGEYFIWTGKIQGPQGQKGESTYLFTRYADDQNGGGFDPSPVGKKYIGFYRHSENILPSDIGVDYNTWKWVKYVGDDAKSISLNASTQVFRVDKEGKVSPSTLTVTPQAVNTSINKWEYNTNGGTFSTTPPAGVVRGSDGKVTVTGTSMTANSISIRMGDGTYSDTLTVYKVFDGDKGDKGTDAPIAFLTNENITFAADINGQIAKHTVYCNVVGYIGTSKVIPTIGTISGLPIGMTINQDAITTNESNELVIPIEIGDNATFGSAENINGSFDIPVLTPVRTNLKLTWSKVNSGPKGDTGIGIKSITVMYGTSDSAETQPPEDSWQLTLPNVADGKYLWTFTIIDYTDDSIPDTVTCTYAKQGEKGDTGSTGNSVTVSKIEYQSGTSATTAPTSTWSNGVVSVAEGDYLWTKTTFSDGKTAYGVARQGKDGAKGDTGRGVSSIVEQYYQSTSATTQSGGTWSAAVPTWVDGKYIWTRSVITYTDTTTSTTSPVCVTGQKGGTGNPGISVSSVDVWYYQSTSATSLSGGSWSTTAPTWSDGKYVWTKTITTYTNDTTDETAAVCITGQKGSSGVGVQSITEYYLATSSNSGVTTSTPGWTTTIQTITNDKRYLWNYEVVTYTNGNTSPTTPVIIGVFGDQGVQGPKGNDGQQYYTWVKYADTPTSGMSNDPEGKAYIGLAYNKTTATESNTYSDYMWSLIKGETGAIGPKGNDGQQYYTWIKYADNASGTNMSDSPNGKSYIGLAYNKTTSTKSNTASDYTWALFKGDKGNDGVGISSTTVTYGVSDSSSTQPTSWQSSIPTVADGKYLWTRTVIDYTDTSKADTVSYTYSKQGTKGDQGSAGSSVTVTSIQYQEGTSATTAPTGTWSNSVVSVGDGKYLWTKTVFSDGKTAYGVAKQGSIGATGKGIKSVTEYYLATSSASGVTTSTSGWTTTMQTLTSTNKYLWNYELITYTDDSKATINPVIIGVYGDKGNQGDKGVDSVTFQVYAPNGYLLTKDLDSLTLQTFAYEGSAAITSGATYQWAQYNEDAWENISGATTQTLTVTKNDIVKSKSYKCTMTYKSKQYTDTATVQDKTDIYSSLIQTAAKYSSTNKYYWVLYSMVYSDEGERDKLLGPINTIAPDNPTNGQYWYKIDETNYTVTLMKYSGTTWAATTDKQELVYDWSLINDADIPISLGSQSKVKIVTASDFSKTCSVQCNIRGSESIPISYSNQILIDPSDPIISSEEPINPTPGQLWIKAATNGLYTLLVWDASLEKWVTSEADSRVKVHISKPSSYEVGDVWVVGSDYEPTIYVSGVAQTTKHLAGTMLKAQYSSQSYKDSDWVEALNYKKEIDGLKDDLNTYNQFFDFDEDGLTMQAKNKSGVVSEFKTKLTNTELGFYQGDNKVAHINNNQLNISKAEITNGMTIKGSAPVLDIGNFTIMQESNGSLSIGLKS